MEEEIQPETETRNLPRAFPATANYVGWKGDSIFFTCERDEITARLSVLSAQLDV